MYATADFPSKWKANSAQSYRLSCLYITSNFVLLHTKVPCAMEEKDLKALGFCGLFFFSPFPFKFKHIYINETYFGVMPSLYSIDTEILWVKHFWLSWEHSDCLKEKAFNYWFCLFGSSLRFRIWTKSYEISHLIQFIIAVRSQMKSVELTGKSRILNEAPWGLKYLLFNVHEISLSSKF